MTDKYSGWKKLIAASLTAVLLTAMGLFFRFSTVSMRNSIIEKKGLQPILDEIKATNIDTKTLSSVLREPPPLLFIFIATLISVAITVWLYHQFLRLLNKKETGKKKTD